MPFQGHVIPPRKVFRSNQAVVVSHVAGWGDRRGDIQWLPAVVVMATPQYGDTYQVRYDEDGRTDIVDVNRIEAAE